MKKESKIWGTTIEILKTPFVEVHRASILKGGNCSVHKHLYKINGFYVESGQIMIRKFQDNGLIDETVLSAGDYTDCQPNEKHQFRALEDSIVFEFYYPMQIGDVDIERDSVGFME